MEKIWYVYRHVRLDSNVPFYIGLGKEDPKGRKHRAYLANKSCRSSSWFDVVSRTEYRVDILVDGLSSEEARTKEKEFIILYGKTSTKGGTLVNITSGGDGVWLTEHSEETKRKISEGKMGARNPMFGKQLSVEHRSRISKSSIGAIRCEEVKKNQSKGQLLAGHTKACEVTEFKTGVVVGRFYGISEACRQLGIHNMNGKAVMVAKGKRRQTKGYVFKYI